MGFRPLRSRSVRWRPASGTGIEHLTLSRSAGKIVARSVVVGEDEGRHYGVRYTIICDRSWVVRSLDLETTTGLKLSFVKDRAGRWRDRNWRVLAKFDGCVDVDLMGTPFTNTLPIRRLDLSARAGAVELRVLYVPFDSFKPVVHRQRYTCIGRGRLYRFEVADGSFSADISVDADGLVIHYPGLFERVPMVR
jgi:hypothetical protein